MPEALITINGTTLTNEQSRTISAALAAYSMMLQDLTSHKSCGPWTINRQIYLDQIISLIEETV